MNPYSDVASNMLLKDRVYNTLKNEIILGHLKPGQVLNIYELSAKMNISGAPVREALSMLGKDGFVSLAPRRSATVASATLRDWEVVAEMRLLLEPFAVKISTPDIPQSEIDNLRQRFSYLLTHPEDVYTHLEADRDLHRLLHAHAGSLFLSETLATLKEHSARARYFSSNSDDAIKQETILASTKEHLAILDAIDSRDPDKAAEMVRIHLSQYMHRITDHEE